VHNSKTINGKQKLMVAVYPEIGYILASFFQEFIAHLSFGCHNDSSYDLYAYKGIHLKDAKD
jgi:hypothetical protein